MFQIGTRSELMLRVDSGLYWTQSVIMILNNVYDEGQWVSMMLPSNAALSMIS
jgi:hypothetical protein